MNKKIKVLTGALLIMTTCGAFAKNRNIREALNQTKNILINQARILENAQEFYSPEILDKLQSEITTCGLSTKGPSCLDTEFALVTSDTIQKPDLFTSLSLLKSKNEQRSILLAIEINRNEKYELINSVKFFNVKNKSKFKVIKKNFLRNRLALISEIEVPKSMIDFAKNQINTTENYKTFYHSSLLLVSDNASKQELAQAIRKKYPLFKADESGPYQFRLLRLVRSVFPNDNEMKKSLASLFIDSKNRDVMQLSSITLAEMGENNEQIKAGVKQSLSNNNWSIRVLAVKAFENIKEGPADENTLLLKIIDYDSDVVKAVKAIINNYTITQNHMETLQTLGDNSSWKIRQLAINLMAKFDSIDSSNYIIGKLIDKDSDVKSDAFKIITNRKLTTDNLSALIPLASNSNWKTRRMAIKLLYKVGGQEAKYIIMTKLTDPDSDVKATANLLMQKINLTERDIPFFRDMLRSNQWKRRVTALNYLSRINNLEVQIIYINSLTDKDSGVKKAARKFVDKLTLTKMHIPAIKKLITSNSWAVRRLGVLLIAKIASIDTTNILIGRISDPDSDVSREAKDAVSAVTLVEKNIGALAKLLNSSNGWKKRKIAATFLGKIQSKKAYDVLASRLRIESDSDVKNAIESAISQIKI